MKLVFVTTTYPPIVGGAETYVQQFATHLAHHHHDVSVITRCHHQRPHPLQRTFTYAEPSSSAVEDGVRVHTIGLSSADKLLLAPVYRLHFYRPTVSTAIVMAEHVYGRRLEETGLVPDVVHYNGTGRELLGQAALRWARRHGAQFVVIPHTHPGTWGDSERDISFYKKADAVFIDTQHELAYLKSRGIPADRCRIVGNGIAPSEWTTLEAQAASLRERYTLRRFVVLFVGRRSSAKGYRQFLAAAPLVWRELTDVSFCLVGPPVTDEPSDGEPIMSDPRICDLGTVSEEVKHARRLRYSVPAVSAGVLRACGLRGMVAQEACRRRPGSRTGGGRRGRRDYSAHAEPRGDSRGDRAIVARRRGQANPGPAWLRPRPAALSLAPRRGKG